MSKIVNVKAAVSARDLGVSGTEDKADRERAAAYVNDRVRDAVQSAARSVAGGVTARNFDAKYTRKGNVKLSFVVDGTGYASDSEVQDRVLAVLNPLSRSVGASNLDVQVADLDA